MNLIVETYWISLLMQMLAIAALANLIVDFGPYQWFGDQFNWPRKPFYCPTCIGWWASLFFFTGQWSQLDYPPYWIVFFSAITSLIATVLDQKVWGQWLEA